MGPGRGFPESCCSLLQGEFEGVRKGKRLGDGGEGRAEGVRASVTWSLSSTFGTPLLENQTYTYTEGVCTLWYHSELWAKQRQKRMIPNEKI